MTSKLEKIERAVSQKRINLTNDDVALIVELSRRHSLETKPGGPDNWVEAVGGEIPDYISQIALALIRSGKTKSQAISIAISRCKAWAAGGDGVNADTRAKAAKAIAEWNALRAKAAAKKAAKTKK